MVATILEEEAGVESNPAGVNSNLEVNSSDQHRDTNVESLYDDKLNDGDDWTISEVWTLGFLLIITPLLLVNRMLVWVKYLGVRMIYRRLSLQKL